MAGQTNNTDILAALNQQIQAINDLITGIGSVVTALGNMSLECNNNVNCTPEVSPVVNVTCGGVSGGSEFVAANGEQGGTPPAGFEEPDPETENRKCKASNAITFTVWDVCTKLLDAGAQTYAGLGAAIVGGLVGAVLGSAAPPFGTLIGAVLGVVAGIVTAIVGGSIQLSAMADAIDANPQPFVCGLYAATDADGAREAFVAAMQGEITLTTASEAFLNLILPNNLLNLLFFTWTAEAETAIDEVSMLFGCSNCSENAVEWHFTLDLEGWAIDDESTEPCATTAEWSDQTPVDPLNDVGHALIEQHWAATGYCWAEFDYTYTDGPVISSDTLLTWDYYFHKMSDGRFRARIIDDQEEQWAVEYNDVDAWTTRYLSLDGQTNMYGHKVALISFILDRGQLNYDSWFKLDRVTLTG